MTYNPPTIDKTRESQVKALDYFANHITSRKKQIISFEGYYENARPVRITKSQDLFRGIGLNGHGTTVLLTYNEQERKEFVITTDLLSDRELIKIYNQVKKITSLNQREKLIISNTQRELDSYEIIETVRNLPITGRRHTDYLAASFTAGSICETIGEDVTLDGKRYTVKDTTKDGNLILEGQDGSGNLRTVPVYDLPDSEAKKLADTIRDINMY